ncbi:TPA: hypothetical protein N0F65_002603 [Lagenidium giganteum]|uniref:Uncharacterized protein n=1 Tax=Lagenidium giganteum TaxID=4803 RepID=A0AAV2YZT6_9STRA|nr:TPA: hypothetical protein N0F65_002603 [Lagenidium giganteum]
MADDHAVPCAGRHGHRRRTTDKDKLATAEGEHAFDKKQYMIMSMIGMTIPSHKWRGWSALAGFGCCQGWVGCESESEQTPTT